MRLIIQPDYSAVSQWAANYVVAKIKKANPTEEKPFVLGLPTGSSPLGMYKALIGHYKQGNVSFKNVITFNMDEYVGLPEEHPESYHSFMWNNFFSYIDIGSIDNQRQRLNEQETVLTASKAPSRARKIVKNGDILYSTVRPYLHNMCITDKSFCRTPIASTGFAVMACYQGLFNRFLFYYLLSPNFDSYANDTENAKGVAYPAINDTRLFNALVPIPPMTEQLHIVERIEDLLIMMERL